MSKKSNKGFKSITKKEFHKILDKASQPVKKPKLAKERS